MTPKHPTQREHLIVLAAVTLFAGILSVIASSAGDVSDRVWLQLLQWMTVTSFTLFIVVCSALIFGWLLREHAVWRQLGGPARLAAEAREQADVPDTRQAEYRMVLAERVETAERLDREGD